MTERPEIVTLSTMLTWYAEDQGGMEVPSVSNSEVSRLYQTRFQTPRKPETVHRIGNNEESLVVFADFPHFDGYKEALTSGLTPEQYHDLLGYERPEVSLAHHSNLGGRHHMEMGDNEGLRELVYGAMTLSYRSGFELGLHRLGTLEEESS